MKHFSILAISALALGGCAVGPTLQAPPPVASQTYLREGAPAPTANADGVAQAFTTSDHAVPRWWERFGSAPLNRMVDQALAQSPTLEAARERLVAARESYRAQAGALEYPAIDARLSGTRQQVNLGAFGIQGLPSPGPFTLYDASVSVSYTFDVFGANRQSLAATKAQVDYQSFQLQAAQLSLAGNVVAAAIRRAALQSQIELTEHLVKAQARQLRIAQARLAAGGLAEADVRNLAAALARTRATLPPLAAQKAQTEHRLTVLMGIEPAQADLSEVPLASLRLPAQVPLVIPSALAQERPDIRAAQALVNQSGANVGVATANLYPQFSISAGAGSQRTRISDIVDGLNIWNIGLNLTQPLFHGGELRARQRAAQADYAAAMADYRQTVLQALQQVADALRQLDNDARVLQARADAARLATANWRTAQQRYAAGGISEYDLLDTRQQLLRATLDQTQSQADRLVDTAALFQSLGCACELPDQGLSPAAS